MASVFGLAWLVASSLWGEWGDTSWAGSPREGAADLLECALGRYSSDALSEWQLPVGFDGVAAARRVAACPDVWTDGSLVENKVSGASSAGTGCFTYRCSRLWANWRWDHLDDDVRENAVISACRGFCSVQIAEFWGVFLALQANDGVHLRVDNLNVVRVCWPPFGWQDCFLLSWLRMGILLCLLRGCSVFGGWTRFVLLRLRVMLMRLWFGLGELVILIGWVIMERMKLLILVVGGCLGGLLMLEVIILGFVLVGARLSQAFIGFLLPLPER